MTTTTLDSIIATNVDGIINGTNREIVDENSNKNATAISVQRDLIAGEVSKAIGAHKVFSKKLLDANDDGIIHIHDLDYAISPGMINCCLPNFRDMLMNGTVINGVMIETPKSLRTAVSVLAQIAFSISGSQYGGQSVNNFPDVLAPFVRRSFHKTRTMLKNMPEFTDKSDNALDAAAWKLTRKEISESLQGLQYDLNSYQGTNGQSPFITLFLNFDPHGDYAHEAAMIVEETLRQRIMGVKNSRGVYITPAFPKLVYVLDEWNVYKDSPYYYLTELAAECTMKRMYPDYISAPMMRKNYEGQVFAPMGCVSGEEMLCYRHRGNIIVNSFEHLWDSLTGVYTVMEQNPGDHRYLYMDVNELDIWDTKKNAYVPVRRLIRNVAREWRRVSFQDDAALSLLVTADHPFDTENRGIVEAQHLTTTDRILVDTAWHQSYRGMSEKNVQSCHVSHVTALTYHADVFSYDVTTDSGHFEVSGVYSHNCRSFLPPYKNESGDYQFDGRFNKGVCTINLPDIGLTVGRGNEDEFFALLDERLENYVRPVLEARHNFVASGTTSSSPIHWCYGGLARLPLGEKIPSKYLTGFYSTLSIGYIGIEEACQAVLGESHTTERGTQFAIRIMEHLNAARNRWNEETPYGYSIYGTPAESLTSKACAQLVKKFGIVKGVNDKGYLTNSYHYHVLEPVTVFDKFDFENQFQSLSQGGCISYAELGNMNDNREAMLSLIDYGFQHIQYFEFNLRGLDYCAECGFSGEMEYDKDKDMWECPMCGNHNKESLYVVRRTCGYLGSNFWISGRAMEIADRVLHI